MVDLAGDSGGWSPSQGLLRWEPDARPASLSARDQYFSALNWGSWATWDPGAYANWDVDPVTRMGRVTATGNAAVRWTGKHIAVTNPQFIVATQLNSVCVPGASGQAVGLMVAGDIVGSPATAALRTIDLAFVSGVPSLRARTWTNYGGSASSIVTVALVPTHLRIRANGTSVAFDYSVGGVTWSTLSTLTLGFTPAYFGPCFSAVDNLVESQGLFRYVRTLDGVFAYNTITTGRLVSQPYQ